MDPQPSAPPVVVVVVTTDPGDWFEECLDSVAGQDYPNLSVLVVDTASAIDPTPRVAAVLPRAYVRRLPGPATFGEAANEVLDMVEGASHYLFCHDDVALAPDAVRLLVEEAFRSNAGITTPKVVAWDDPSRLLAVGASADRMGVMHPLVEPGELDQEQHDAVRDVFLAPSSATLVRADLFAALAGFDRGVGQFGEDLDLCWRAQIAGARVVATPAARVQHRQAQVEGKRRGWQTKAAAKRARALADQHRVRIALTCYGLFHLLWLAPVAAVQVLAEALIHLARGQVAEAGALVTAPVRAFTRPRQLWASRRRAQRARRVRDGEVHRLQSRGNTRLRALVRSALGGDVVAPLGDDEAQAMAVTGPERVAEVPPRVVADHSGWRWPALLVGALILVFLIGSWSLLNHQIPAVGRLPVAGGGVGGWWRLWWSPWRPNGLGSAAASPPGLGLLALVGTVFFGAVGALEHVLVLGPLIAGPWGAWRAARPLGSRRGSIAAVVVYAVIPLPYDALAGGHWAGLLAYAAAPWVLVALARASGERPFRSDTPPWLSALRLGLLVAVLAAFVPAAIFVVPLMGAALGAALVLTGNPGAGGRALVASLAAAAVATVLLLPWSAHTLGSAVAVFGVGGGKPLGLGAAMRFQTGPLSAGELGWAFLFPAALPLAIGRSWRLGWATRCWAVAVVFWALAWAGTRGWLPFADPEVMLAPAAAAVALAAATGVASFEKDLSRYRFGWRQLASGVAVVAAVVGAVPVLGAAISGRWDLPTSDASSALVMPGQRAGNYRVLWVGAPSALPLGVWKLSPGVGYATSSDGEPALGDLWPSTPSGATPLLASDLRLAENRSTTDLGHLLAPLAVRYLIIPNHNAPSGSGAAAVPVPGSLLAGLSMQTDLQLLRSDPNYTVYVNAAWAPQAAVVPGSSTALTAGVKGNPPAAAPARQRLLLASPLKGSRPVLASGVNGSGQLSVPAGGTLYVASTHSSRWHLRSAAGSVAPARAFGWAMAFPARPGPATLTVSPPAGARAGQLLEVAAWAVLIALLILTARRRRARRGVAPVVPAAEAVLVAGDRRPVPVGAAGMDPDEMWNDA